MTSRLSAGLLGGLLLYFAYHAFAGEKGLGQWSAMQRTLAERQAELAVLNADLATLEDQIRRLTPGSIDPDFVEGLARETLAYAYADEVVIVDSAVNDQY